VRREAVCRSALFALLRKRSVLPHAMPRANTHGAMSVVTLRQRVRRDGFTPYSAMLSLARRRRAAQRRKYYLLNEIRRAAQYSR